MQNNKIKSNAEIQYEAKKLLIANWKFICAANSIPVLFLIFSSFLSVSAYTIIAILILNILQWGQFIYALEIVRGKHAGAIEIYKGFTKQNYIRVLGAGIFWSLPVMLLPFSSFPIVAILLFMPVIIVALYLGQIYFIIGDEASISSWGAAKRSWKMMQNFKWQLFCLLCRFIPWVILIAFTLGLAAFWVIPYLAIATAKFYDQVKIHSLESHDSMPIAND